MLFVFRSIAFVLVWFYAQDLRADIPLKTGELAPSFRLRTPKGALVRLDEIAYPGPEKSYAKKRPVLLDFFRTDCSPCRISVPELVQLHNEFGPQGLQVVMVALLEQEAGRKKLDAFLEQKKLPLTIVIDENEHFTRKFLGNTVPLPTTFLIDANGTVQKIKLGAKGSMRDHFKSEIVDLLEQKR